MKTTKHNKGFLLLCVLVFAVSAATAQSQSKEIKKEFPAISGDILEVENKFGNITILNWDKPEISVSIKLSADSKSEAAAQSILSKMSVDLRKENNTIIARTILNNESGVSQGSRFAVDYTVYVPKWINLTLVNKFGNIHIDEISGLVNIELKHGDLRINNLSRGNVKPYNQLVLAYSNGVIDQAGSLKLDLSFSKIEVEKADVFTAQTKYSGINAITCNSFFCESKYDNFKFDEVKNLSGNLQYSNLKAGKFSGKLELETSYTGVKIEQVLPSFESIKINNSRGSYKIGIHPETSFDLYGNSSRGEFDLEEFKILEKKTEGSSKTIRAVAGKEGTGKLISISSVDGTVSLFLN